MLLLVAKPNLSVQLTSCPPRPLSVWGAVYSAFCAYWGCTNAWVTSIWIFSNKKKLGERVFGLSLHSPFVIYHYTPLSGPLYATCTRTFYYISACSAVCLVMQQLRGGLGRRTYARLRHISFRRRYDLRGDHAKRLALRTGKGQVQKRSDLRRTLEGGEM